MTMAPHRQRGAGMLMATVFLLLVVALLGLIGLRLASTDINDTALQNDSVGALFLAESGLERAAQRLADGTATCDATLAASWSFASGTITIADLGAGFSTDFNGAALGAGRCRVRVTGSTGLYSVQRTVEGIINTAGNLLGSANANFNAPAGVCPSATCTTPTGWNLSVGEWLDNGGPDGSRSAYVAMNTNGQPDITTGGQFAMTPFTVTAPTTLTMTFDYMLVSSNTGGAHTMTIAMNLFSGATTFAGASLTTAHTGTYQSGTITFNITGSGPVTIDGFEFSLIAKAGRAKWGYLDNLYLAGGGGGGTASIERWREIIQ